MLMTVLAGQPVMDTSNLALVLVNVTIAVPLQVDSASVIGGFSFDAFRSALKTLATVGAGPCLTAEGRDHLPCPVESGLSAAALADATVQPARLCHFSLLSRAWRRADLTTCSRSA